MIRQRIDDIDRQIVGLMAQREIWVRRAGKVKSGPHEAAAPARAAQVVAAVTTAAEQLGADPGVVRATYVAMVEAFIRLESDTIAARTDQPGS